MNARSVRLAVSLAAVFFAGIAVSTASADGPKPCARTPETAQVKEACAKGGQDAAKKMMKAMVDKAKAAGNEIKCNACHENLKTYELTKNGMADFKKMI